MGDLAKAQETTGLSGLTFAQALSRAEALNAIVHATSDRLQVFPRGPLGLTPDSVRQTPEFQEAKRQFDIAFSQARAFNGWYTKVFKKELSAYRQQVRARALLANGDAGIASSANASQVAEGF